MRATSRTAYLVAVALATLCASLEAQGTAPAPSIERAIASAKPELSGVEFPAAAAFTTGDREIRAGTTVNGPVAVIGTLKVAGTINGDAFAYAGDVIVLAGGHITGSVVALYGHVQPLGGAVDGDMRSIGGVIGTLGAVATVTQSTSHNVALTLGWAAVALLVGIGLLVFGGPTLDAVGETIDQHFGRSFVVGFAATLGIVPVLALLIVGLALTILGVLLVPFAIVAYVLAVIGLITLGFLAAVRVTGQAFPGSGGSRALSDRGAALRALLIGLTFFLGLWTLAALLTPMPEAMAIARLVAFAMTWAAATVGLGATIISRAGTRTVHRSAYAAAYPGAYTGSHAVDVPASAPLEQAAAFVAPLPNWQTPTPVPGVVAARRSGSLPGKTP